MAEHRLTVSTVTLPVAADCSAMPPEMPSVAPSTRSPLFADKAYDETSVFQVDALIREARRQRSLPPVDVPEVCLLDPDGDVVRHLRECGRTTRLDEWACYHSELWCTTVAGADGGELEIGVVPCAVGGPYAVLVAEQLHASGCRLVVSVTSAGRIIALGDPPYFVLIDRARRDEGTSHHYLAPSEWAWMRPHLAHRLSGGIEIGERVTIGSSWTTDAPFRETTTAIAAAEAAGVHAVEMEAAGLYAYAEATGNDVVCVAHVTNTMAVDGDDFEKGEDGGTGRVLTLVSAVAERVLNPAPLPAFPDWVIAVGEEGSDPVVTVDGGNHRHDQFAQSGHYAHQQDDLDTISSLGVEVVRYGMPWRLTEPSPGVYDWTLWDAALRACDRAGLAPVVDLLHFGLPDHAGRFIDREWVDAFRRYVTAFLGRYRDVAWFTPINEPGVTALLSGRFGLWNDRLASAAEHAQMLANVVLANLEALAIIDADRDAWWLSSEGFGVTAFDPATSVDGEEAAAQRRAVDWLVWDLQLGVTPLPEADGYLDPVDSGVRTRIGDLAREVRSGFDGRIVVGHDVYPTSMQWHGADPPSWSVQDRVAIAGGELRRWYQRYRLPFWISETSNLSLPVSEQIPWLEAIGAELDAMRGEALPVRGFCWYSRGDQYDWMTALSIPTGVVTEVGLFDADRRARPVADVLARLAE